MRTVIIFPPSIFLKRDYDRFQIDFLKKYFVVKVLDFTPYVNKAFWELHKDKVFICENYFQIKNKEDFMNLKDNLKSSVIIDHLCDKNTNWAKGILKKLDCTLVQMDVNLIPESSSGLFYKIKKLTNIKFIISRVLNFLKFQFNFIMARSFIPDILIVGGLAAKKRSVKRIIHAHSMDYDHYINLKKKNIQKKNNKPYAVFLDEDMPNHSDYLLYGIESPINEKVYYVELLNFFKKFEKHTGLKIKFAAHPKTDKKKINSYLDNIDVVYGKTAETVLDSKIALLHCSTSISFPVLLEKPIYFLTSNSLKESWIGNRITNFSKNIDGKLINISNNLNNQIDLKKIFKYNKKKYIEYKNQYLKYPDTSDLPLWKLLKDEFTSKKNV